MGARPQHARDPPQRCRNACSARALRKLAEQRVRSGVIMDSRMKPVVAPMRQQVMRANSVRHKKGGVVHRRDVSGTVRVSRGVRLRLGLAQLRRIGRERDGRFALLARRLSALQLTPVGVHLRHGRFVRRREIARDGAQLHAAPRARLVLINHSAVGLRALVDELGLHTVGKRSEATSAAGCSAKTQARW